MLLDEIAAITVDLVQRVLTVCLGVRRITNRESAQRMRRKRQEEYQGVVDSLAGMQAENAKLKQVAATLTCSPEA